MAKINYKPVVASEDEQSALHRVESVIGALVFNQGDDAPRLVMASGEAVELPASIVQVLKESTHYLSNHQAVSILPVDRDLTSQEAANLLNISRPYLIHLLDEGAIPFSKTGTHRRIKLTDVLRYKQTRDSQRRASLQELTRLSEEFGLYDPAEG